MSYIFQEVTGTDGALSFQFNGQFALKNYNVEIVNGNRLKVVSTTNEMFSLLEAEVSEVEINGQIYSDANAAKVALQTLVYSNSTPVVLTEEKYLQLAAAVQAADRGKILPDTPAPSGGWQPGWYTAGLATSADPGTNYPNQNNLKAKKGFITKFLFNGTLWDFVEYEIPQARSVISNLKTSTVGLVDTYTTTYSDGSTSTYEIVNGVHDLEGISYLKPLKWNPVNYDITKVRGVAITGDVPLLGWGYVSYLINTENKLINAIGYFISSKIPNNIVIAKLYETTDSYENFSPTSANSTLLAERTFENFNQNANGRFWWFLDLPVKSSAGKRPVLVFETVNENSLVVYRVTGGLTNLRERRVTQGLYYLDINGFGGDEPIMTLMTASEITNIKNSDIFSRIIISDTFPAVVGKQACLYLSNILNLPNTNNLTVRFREVATAWQSADDINLNIHITDYGISYKPTQANEIWKSAIEVIDNNYNIIARKNIAFKSYHNNSITTPRVAVVTADSLGQYNDFEFVKYLANLCIEGGLSINFIGNKNTSISGVYCNSYEGKGYSYFYSNQSPYYVNGEVNFKAWAESKGVTNVDDHFIQLGINDLYGANVIVDLTDEDIEDLVYEALIFINICLSPDKGFPNMNLFISREPYGGIGGSLKASKSALELKRKMFIYYKYLDKILGDIPNVHFVDSYAQIDRENSYPFTLESPNEYDNSGTLVRKYSDFVHPELSGNRQNAAAIYFKLREILN